MIQSNDTHRIFASYFKSKAMEPFLFMLSKRMSEGHICLDLNLSSIDLKELKDEASESLVTIDKLKNDSLVSDGSAYTPFVIWNDQLYLQRFFQYESQILNKIRTLIEFENTIQSNLSQQLITHKKLIQTLFPYRDSSLVDWQMIASISAILNQFTIITGGPGTGKTTTVARILSLLYALQPDIRIALAAPTGKAATRMADSLKSANYPDETTKEKVEILEPSTIHRLLGARKGSIYFKHNTQNPIAYDLVIIDESSMIDIALFAKLLDAIHPNTKIIMLGDKNQLASVEAGSIFGDLCMAQKQLNGFSPKRIALFKEILSDREILIPYGNQTVSDHLLFEHVIELQHSHRFSADDGIGKFSKAVIQNQTDIIKEFFESKDEKVTIDDTYSEAIFRDFINGFSHYIKEPDTKKAFQKLNQLRILCGIREGEEGVFRINEKIEEFLQHSHLIHKNTEFYEHRPIIITKNNYELKLFNGDIGIVRKDASGILKVWFEDNEGRLKAILPASIDYAETVYAMTIHKSQGSEFNKVMVILPKNAELTLLTRELLYTAITRARDQVIMQGSKEVILESTNRSVRRGSGIADRIEYENHNK